MTRRANTGSFEPCLVPDEPVAAPKGIARLIAAEEAHLTDLERLPVHEEED
jgi:hypothetical protein